MSITANTLQNNALAALSRMAPQGVSHAIQQASSETGVDFAYLLQQAQAESSFDVDAKAKTSSASGLYQFIESTWMSMVDKYGEKYGLDTKGKSRAEILDLRNDPKTASFMAAEFASENQKFLQTHVNENVEIGSTELYFAHFLGAGKAAAFLNARQADGSQPAAVLFPKAASANKNVFFDSSTGSAKSLDEVYAYFEGKFELEGHIPAETETSPVKVASSKSYTPRPPSAGSTYRPSSLYSDLFTNSLDVLFLSQMMDLSISRKGGEFTLFSTRGLLK